MASLSTLKRSTRLLFITTLCSGVASGAYAGTLTEKQISDFYEYSERVTLNGGDELIEYIKKHVHENASLDQDVTLHLFDGSKKETKMTHNKEKFLKDAIKNQQQSTSEVINVETTVLRYEMSGDGQSAHVFTTNKIEALNDVPTPQGKTKFKSLMDAECEDEIAWDQSVGIVVTASSCTSEITLTPVQ